MKFAKLYAMDKKAETEGAWIRWQDDAELRIARHNNPEAQRIRGELIRAWERATGRKGKMTPEDSRRINCEVLARGVVRDWRGFDLSGPQVAEALAKHNIAPPENLKSPAYSWELCFALLMEFPDFANDVAMVATSETTFRAEEVEEAGEV